ncbi:MAG: putative bacterial extracellular solute-binding protein [Rhizobacter sp.]|nr:putative bacterial extracellular solute-binding protein [Rhizobacter sp.]
MKSSVSSQLGPRSSKRPAAAAASVGISREPSRGIDELRHSRRDINVGLCVPMNGLAGIWGPSALACAKLAVAEINASGIGGRHCRLVTVDAADDAQDLEERLIELVDAGEVDALVGMHTSAARQRVLRAVGSRLPFVYTPTYEGGECTPGVFAIGETPPQQLRPAFDWLHKHTSRKRWMFIGNDYVYPRVAHRMARDYVAETGGELVAEVYLPFGSTDFGEVLDQLRSSGADSVLLSLIGQDAIAFNRAFGERGFSDRVVRLSAVIEENELLGIGFENTENLYVASSYFSTLHTDANLSFKERYQRHFGDRAPTLNAMGQSTYEGVHFLGALLGHALGEGTHEANDWMTLGESPLHYRSARETTFGGTLESHPSIYLGRANGHAFEVIGRL